MILDIVITTSDCIQIASALITLLGTLSSLYIARKTLKQNNKMIEDASRPCVVIYKDTIDINSPSEYIVIKNFGTSPAFITELTFDKDKFKKIDDGDYNNLKYFNNITLAPNQRYLLPINTKNSNFKDISFSVKYSGSTNIEYNETFNINLSQDYAVVYDKQVQNGKELKMISSALQELIKRIS